MARPRAAAACSWAGKSAGAAARGTRGTRRRGRRPPSSDGHQAGRCWHRRPTRRGQARSRHGWGGPDRRPQRCRRQREWGLSPVGGPWEAWGSLMDPCGRSRLVGPPRSSCVAYVGRVCHCHCGGDRSSRHPVRLVWVNGSFGCRTIAARTRDLILDTIHVLRAYTTSYLSYCDLLK